MRRLNRRIALGLIAGASMPFVAIADQPLRVLFVGNSFIIEHDLPLLFADIARQGGHSIHVDVIAAGGAYLADVLAQKDAYDLYRDYDPQLIVLQDHSTVALDAEAAARSRRAMSSLCRLPVRRILFATWARAEGHRLYNQPGMPATPVEMTDLTERHYQARHCPSLAEASLSISAPVGRAWLLGNGLPLHRSDGYHASLTGAWLSALVLARTAGLAPDAPTAPDGVAFPGRLAQIARLIVP